MRSVGEIEWFLDESALPDLFWAFLMVLPDSSLEIVEWDGGRRRFVSLLAAAEWLSEEEYVRPSSIDTEELTRLGLSKAELRAPLGSTHAALLPQMCRRLACAEAIRELSAVRWTEPWVSIVPDEREGFEAELRRELDAGHSLSGRDARAFLRRVDRDDVLFVVSRPVQLAVVHLTYEMQPPDRPPWPTSEVYDQVWRFVDRTLRDAAEYGAG